MTRLLCADRPSAVDKVNLRTKSLWHQASLKAAACKYGCISLLV
jgi:hypothetical protein